MNPEPLTKEKILEKNIDMLNYIYENLIDRKDFTKEEKEGFFEDVKSIAHGLVDDTLKEVKQRVNWLLKEIEKREKELEDWHSAKSSGVSFLGVKDGWEYRNALRWVKDLIKKATLWRFVRDAEVMQ